MGFTIQCLFEPNEFQVVESVLSYRYLALFYQLKCQRVMLLQFKTILIAVFFMLLCDKIVWDVDACHGATLAQ